MNQSKEADGASVRPVKRSDASTFSFLELEIILEYQSSWVGLRAGVTSDPVSNPSIQTILLMAGCKLDALPSPHPRRAAPHPRFSAQFPGAISCSRHAPVIPA
jgi:hypothetical protein